MPRVDLVKTVRVVRSPRVLQLEGMFDLPPTASCEQRWQVELPIETQPWQLGLIVGPSGSGKTTLARHLFGTAVDDEYSWPADRSLLDAFPESMGIKEVVQLLHSVGFSSPPSWLRPYATLSNGEQFRARMARALAENQSLTVVDEFTSVVDRTVAKVTSVALAKAIRRTTRQFVALSCHDDIVDWLDPDWVYEPAVNRFSRRSVRSRPTVALVIRRVSADSWPLFRRHHYLSQQLNPLAQCYVAFWENRPAAFTAVIAFPHPRRPGWREHRTVCLPDFQGLGIGTRLSDWVAGCYAATGKPFYSVTGNLAMVAHRQRSTLWQMTRPLTCISRNPLPSLAAASAANRFTASFRYIGPALYLDALGFGLLTHQLARSGIKKQKNHQTEKMPRTS